MRKILIPLLVMILLCVSTAALADGNDIKLELNTAKLAVYEADDPYLKQLGMTEQPEEDVLPVLVLPVRKILKLQVTVTPKTVRNKKFTLAVDDEKLVQVRGNALTGLKPGVAELTIASAQDPKAALRYRVLVIQPVTRISLTAPAKTVGVGKTLTLTPAFVPDNATLKSVTWSSSNNGIATVDKKGNVTGVKRGTVRITALSKDGGNIRANISIQVVQMAEKITLDKKELTVDAGRTGVLRATVLPADTNDKKVIWTSSDEKIAKVNPQGRVTGVKVGDCEIICTSKTSGQVEARAVVHVQQPVKKVSFKDAPAVYVGESAQLSWKIEPADATNQAVSFKSANEGIVKVDQDGKVTGVKAGETYVTVITKDGSNRQAKVKVKVFQHVTGVHMKRSIAYIDLNTSSTTTAILEPSRYVNTNMTWKSADPSVATAEPAGKETCKVSIYGLKKGTTTVTGTTEDGGHKASITVKVGDWENSLKWIEGKFGARGQFYFQVRNVSDLYITSVTVEVEIYDFDGNPMKGINTRNGSNVVKAVYSKPLNPGATTREDQWKLVDFDKGMADTEGFAAIVSRVTEFQIDNAWVKVIRRNRQPKTVYNPHKVLH